MLDFNDRGVYWTSIDIANHFVLDKQTFSARVQWVENNLVGLVTMSTDADSPIEFNTAVKALRIYEQSKLPAHMIYLDASNQALQLYAVLTADRKTASTCNLANGSIMADAYKLLANAMNNHMQLQCFNRSNCKKALMTTMYGKQNAFTEILSSMFPRSQQPEEDFANQYQRDIIADKDNQAMYPDNMSMQNAFREAMIDIAPKAIIAMDAIQSLNDENIGTYYWTLPDGMKVRYDVKTDVDFEYLDYTKNGIKIEVKGTREVYAPSKLNAGMAPNVIHSVDGYVAREIIRRMTAEGKYITTIHDAFGCLPEDCDFLVQTYKDILIEILDQDMLNDILTQIGHTKIGIMKTGDLTKEDIQNSEYLLG